MPSGKAVRSKDLIETKLPDLLVGPDATTSSALHNLRFVGPLMPWPNFLDNIRNRRRNATWSPEILDYRYKQMATKPAANMDDEHIRVGDEGGVQGRFNQQIGQSISAVCKAAAIDVSFGDYKSTRTRVLQGKVPDTVMMTNAGDLLVVGEVKVPWVPKHDLRNAEVKGRLRHILGMYIKTPSSFHTCISRDLPSILGQISRYMLIGNLKYGFISTYEWTIFLKQEETVAGWAMFHSDPIPHHSVVGDTTVTLRGCFWSLALDVNAGHQANNPVARNLWVRPG